MLEKPNKVSILDDSKSDLDSYKQTLSQQLCYKMKQLIDRSFANGYEWTLCKNASLVEGVFLSQPDTGQLFEQIDFHNREVELRRSDSLVGQDASLLDMKNKCLEILRKDGHAPILIQVRFCLNKSRDCCLL